MVFLESLALSPTDLQTIGGNQLSPAGFVSEFTGAMIGVFVVVLLVLLGIYVYFSLAYTAIGKKAKLSNSGVAWMPFMGPLATIFESAHAHWWPFLASILGFSLAWIIAMLDITSPSLAIISVILMTATYILIVVVGIVWHWKTYEAIDKPGWFILIPTVLCVLGALSAFISLISLNNSLALSSLILYLSGILSHLILVGIAAWSD